MKEIEESSLYPIVEKWLKEYHLCFHATKQKMLKIYSQNGKEKAYGRIDVVGVRDIGGDLSGEVETIVVEVKKGNEPFGRASGQTLGYKVYANRVYLADLRDGRFDPDEISIANKLGIGLVQIKNGNCEEVLSSPYYEPVPKLNCLLLENLALGKCQLCDSFFEIGNFGKKKFDNLIRIEDNKKAFSQMENAVKQGKGLMFWNTKVAKRKDKIGIKKLGKYKSYERRFICPDCVILLNPPIKK